MSANDNSGQSTHATRGFEHSNSHVHWGGSEVGGSVEKGNSVPVGGRKVLPGAGGRAVVADGCGGVAAGGAPVVADGGGSGASVAVVDTTVGTAVALAPPAIPASGVSDVVMPKLVGVSSTRTTVVVSAPVVSAPAVSAPVVACDGSVGLIVTNPVMLPLPSI